MRRAKPNLIGIWLILLAFGTLSWPNLARASQQTMFPPDVMEADWYDFYRDWIGPTLYSMGERPLWGDAAPAKGKVVYRFSFYGNLCTVTSIRLWSGRDGGTIQAKTRDRCHGAKRTITHSARAVSGVQWKELERLMAEADLWKFRSGDWDGAGGHEYVDCTFLAMERALGDDYRTSMSQISCIQPEKLIPVVNSVAALARLSHPSLGYRDIRAGEQMR